MIILEKSVRNIELEIIWQDDSAKFVPVGTGPGALWCAAATQALGKKKGQALSARGSVWTRFFPKLNQSN